MPEVSVIIPTYRPDETLFECLTSLERQTLTKDAFEVIIILNGDKEPYFSEISLYLQTSVINARLFYAERAGVSYARNIGIKNARGNYITFIDSDDFVSETYLEDLLSQSSSKGCLALANILCIENGKISSDYLGNLFARLKSEKNYRHFFVRSYFSVPVGKLLPRSTVRYHLFNEELWRGEDGLFMFELEPYLPKAQKASESAIYYRRLTQDSLSRKRLSWNKNARLNIKRLYLYCAVYVRSFWHYDPLFFMTRIAAVARSILVNG